MTKNYFCLVLFSRQISRPALYLFFDRFEKSSLSASTRLFPAPFSHLLLKFECEASTLSFLRFQLFYLI